MSALATRRTLSASTISGDRVHNRAGDDLGYIKDLMIDVNTGRLSYAVLSFGGVFGLGDKLFAVPWQALELHTEDHSFVLDVDQERLQVAEGFDKDNWPDFADNEWGLRIHEFYGVRPYWD